MKKVSWFLFYRFEYTYFRVIKASLSSLLSQKDSFVYSFMHKKFPAANNVVKEVKKELRFNDFETIVPSHKEYSLVCMSLNYRIRFFLKQPSKGLLVPRIINIRRSSLEDDKVFFESFLSRGKSSSPFLFSYKGKSMFGRLLSVDGVNGEADVLAIELEDPENAVKKRLYLEREHLLSKTGILFLEDELLGFAFKSMVLFYDWLQEHDVVTTRLLEDKLEKRFLSGLILLSMFEQKYLSGFTNPLLFELRDWFFSSGIDSFEKISDFLEKRLGSEVILDLYNLSRVFAERVLPVWRQSSLFFLSPAFSGSTLVGGAYADLILDHRLVDIKTMRNPMSAFSKKHVFQLIGYVLLDFRDDYKLREAGFYFSRQALDWWVDVRELLIMSGAKESLEELRIDFLKSLLRQKPGKR